MADDPGRGALSVLLVPEDGGASRTIRLSPGRRKLLKWGGGALALVLLVIIVSWGYLAREAVRARELRQEVETLRAERARVETLARRLSELEGRYDRVQSLFGADVSPPTSDLWLSPGSGRSGAAGDGEPEDGLPTSWPLTQAGWITQPLLEGSEGEHPGLDIAVPTGSYIRAAGSGRVAEVGDDPVYGRFVVLEHGDGYRTLYAHASRIFVEEDMEVRRNEVIALTGSTGRSTAAHLHFEIQREGEVVDPLTLVEQPT